MNVHEAVAKRRSVRGYLETPIAVDRVRELVVLASRAASGGNVQPWHVDIVSGNALARLKATMLGKLAKGETETPEYEIYPKDLPSPYRDYRFAVGEALYGALGIPREDKIGRRMWFARNFAFFGAPCALFVTIDRRMGPPQWQDIGQFLATFMLLAVEEGWGTCAQECWAVFPETVREFLETPEERMLFCGMAIGLEDPDEPANALQSERADAKDWLTLRL
ncbi:MAG: nitroreductase [Sphingomonadaceae bacterium]